MISSLLVSFSKYEPEGRLVQPQRLSKLVDHVSFIREMNALRMIHEANKCGRRRGRLGAVVKFDASATERGRFMSTNNSLENPIESTRADPHRILLIHGLHRVENLKRSLARHG